MRSIQAAESQYYAQFHRYGDFLEIKAAYVNAESGTQAFFRSHNVKLMASASGYRLTAEPQTYQQGYPCCIGCPYHRSFYSDESGILRANRHCQPADARSPQVR